MDHTQTVIFLMALAIFFFSIGLNPLESVIHNIRAKTWISLISMCACFWSIVAAVIVGLSS